MPHPHNLESPLMCDKLDSLTLSSMQVHSIFSMCPLQYAGNNIEAIQPSEDRRHARPPTMPRQIN